MCCLMLCFSFSRYDHNLHRCFTDTRKLIRLPLCKWSDPGPLFTKRKNVLKLQYVMIESLWNLTRISRESWCRGTCKISERLKKSKPESRGFATSRYLALRSSSTKWMPWRMWVIIHQKEIHCLSPTFTCLCVYLEAIGWIHSHKHRREGFAAKTSLILL